MRKIRNVIVEINYLHLKFIEWKQWTYKTAQLIMINESLCNTQLCNFEVIQQQLTIGNIKTQLC